jgi:hypothetical protein
VSGKRAFVALVVIAVLGSTSAAWSTRDDGDHWSGQTSWSENAGTGASSAPGQKEGAPASSKPRHIRHHGTARPPHAGLVFLRTVARSLMQPIGQPVPGAEVLEQPRYVVSPLPAAHRTFDAHHVQASE